MVFASVESSCVNQFKLLTYNLPFCVKLMKGDIDIESCFSQFKKCYRSNMYYIKIFYANNEHEMIQIGSYDLNILYHATKCVIEILKRKNQIYDMLKKDCEEKWEKIKGELQKYNITHITCVDDLLYQYLVNGNQRDLIRYMISSYTSCRLSALEKEIRGLGSELHGYNVSYEEKTYFNRINSRPFYLNVSTAINWGY